MNTHIKAGHAMDAAQIATRDDIDLLITRKYWWRQVHKGGAPREFVMTPRGGLDSCKYEKRDSNGTATDTGIVIDHGHELFMTSNHGDYWMRLVRDSKNREIFYWNDSMGRQGTLMPDRSQRVGPLAQDNDQALPAEDAFSVAVKTPAEWRNEFDIHFDANLGVFGKVLPKDEFQVIGQEEKIQNAISATLSDVTFPTLNVVFAAGSKLQGRNNNKNARFVSLLDDMEVRVQVSAEKDGVALLDEPGAIPAVKVLGMHPFKTKTAKVVKTEDGQFLSPTEGGNALKFNADFAKLIGMGLLGSAPAGLAAEGGEDPGNGDTGNSDPGTGDPSTGDPDTPPKPPARPDTGLGGNLNLSFDLFGKDGDDVRYPIIERSTIFAGNGVSWYLRSEPKDTVKSDTDDQTLQRADGTHFGATFLQVRRDVTHLRIKAFMRTDWKRDNVPLLDETFDILIPVIHPRRPDTPDLADLSKPDAMPALLRRAEVARLLSASAKDIDNLVEAGNLTAFGTGNAMITKASFLRLIEVK